MAVASSGRARDAAWPSLLILVAGTTFLAWRATLGFDLRDGSYIVAITQRLARGELPFVDEVSPHMFGSLLAAPVLAVWREFYGTTGVILVARLTYVVFAAAVAAICWKALGPTLGWTRAAVAISVAVLSLPYNVQLVSYNTVPQLMLLLSFAAGIAAVTSRSVRWGGLCGLSAALASIGYFAVLPAAATLLICVLLMATRRTGMSLPSRTFASAVLLPPIALGLAFLLWLTIVPGWPAVRDAYELMVIGGAGSGVGFSGLWGHFGSGARLLPLALVASLTAVTLVRQPFTRAALLSLSILSVAVWGGRSGEPYVYEPTIGRYAGAVAFALVIVLLPAMLVWLFRRQDSTLRLVTAVALPVAVAGYISTAAMTASGAIYGAYTLSLGGLMVAITVFVWDASDGGTIKVAPLASTLILPSALVASLLAVVLADGPFTNLSLRVGDGPAAHLQIGTLADSDRKNVTGLLNACSKTDKGLWSIGAPGAYVMNDVPSRVPRFWLMDAGVPQNMEAMRSRDWWPGCVLVPTDTREVDRSGKLEAWLRAVYRPVASAPLHSFDPHGTSFTMHEVRSAGGATSHP